MSDSAEAFPNAVRSVFYEPSEEHLLTRGMCYSHVSPVSTELTYVCACAQVLPQFLHMCRNITVLLIKVNIHYSYNLFYNHLTCTYFNNFPILRFFKIIAKNVKSYLKGITDEDIRKDFTFDVHQISYVASVAVR